MRAAVTVVEELTLEKELERLRESARIDLGANATLAAIELPATLAKGLELARDKDGSLLDPPKLALRDATEAEVGRVPEEVVELGCKADGRFTGLRARIVGDSGAYPGVGEVAVIGVDDEKFGQRLAAYVVPRPGAELDEADLKQHVKAQLAGYKVPREVHFLDELPRNATGKVLKRALGGPPAGGPEVKVG